MVDPTVYDVLRTLLAHGMGFYAYDEEDKLAFSFGLYQDEHDTIDADLDLMRQWRNPLWQVVRKLGSAEVGPRGTPSLALKSCEESPTGGGSIPNAPGR